MQAITYLRKYASVLLLTTLAFSNRSWQNQAQVRRALAHLRESGEELGISIENQLALIPRGDQAADQTPLISSASGSSSDLSLELHIIATILLNLNLASRGGLANPPKIFWHINKTISRYQHVCVEHGETKPFSDLFAEKAIIAESNMLIEQYKNLFDELNHRNLQDNFTEQEQEELWDLVYVSKLSMTGVFDLLPKIVPDQKGQAENLKDEVNNLFGDFLKGFQNPALPEAVTEAL